MVPSHSRSIRRSCSFLSLFLAVSAAGQTPAKPAAQAPAANSTAKKPVSPAGPPAPPSRHYPILLIASGTEPIWNLRRAIGTRELSADHFRAWGNCSRRFRHRMDVSRKRHRHWRGRYGSPFAGDLLGWNVGQSSFVQSTRHAFPNRRTERLRKDRAGTVSGVQTKES